MGNVNDRSDNNAADIDQPGEDVAQFVDPQTLITGHLRDRTEGVLSSESHRNNRTLAVGAAEKKKKSIALPDDLSFPIADSSLPETFEVTTESRRASYTISFNQKDAGNLDPLVSVRSTGRENASVLDGSGDFFSQGSASGVPVSSTENTNFPASNRSDLSANIAANKTESDTSRTITVANGARSPNRSGGTKRRSENSKEKHEIPSATTYADATNLAVQYPELAEELLSRPLLTPSKPVSTSHGASSLQNNSLQQNRPSTPHKTKARKPPRKPRQGQTGQRSPNQEGSSQARPRRSKEERITHLPFHPATTDKQEDAKVLGGSNGNTDLTICFGDKSAKRLNEHLIPPKLERLLTDTYQAKLTSNERSLLSCTKTSTQDVSCACASDRDAPKDDLIAVEKSSRDTCRQQVLSIGIAARKYLGDKDAENASSMESQSLGDKPVMSAKCESTVDRKQQISTRGRSTTESEEDRLQRTIPNQILPIFDNLVDQPLSAPEKDLKPETTGLLKGTSSKMKSSLAEQTNQSQTSSPAFQSNHGTYSAGVCAPTTVPDQKYEGRWRNSGLRRRPSQNVLFASAPDAFLQNNFRRASKADGGPWRNSMMPRPTSSNAVNRQQEIDH